MPRAIILGKISTELLKDLKWAVATLRTFDRFLTPMEQTLLKRSEEHIAVLEREAAPEE